MSHIFISYAHDDRAHILALVSWLKAHNFTEHELWYDQHIEGGYAWRDAITRALDEAFAILVVVTERSLSSIYCTYEWAYAMGQSIAVIPLFFDEIVFTAIPAPLASRQLVNCTAQIPQSLREQLHQLRSIPPQISAINKRIFDIINDTHRRFYILGWIDDGMKALDHNFRNETMAYFMEEALKAYQELQTLVVASHLSGKQHRLCWKLMDFLREFSRLSNKSEDYLQQRLFARFDSEWLPAFMYFEGNGWWQKWIRPSFERDLTDEHNRLEAFAEMMRVFPYFNTGDAEILIHNHSLKSL